MTAPPRQTGRGLCLNGKKPPVGAAFWQGRRYSFSLSLSRKSMVMPQRPATPTSA